MLFSVKTLLLLYCVSLCLTSLVQAEPLIVGFPDNPPLVTKSLNGEAAGITVDQIKLVLDRVGLDYTIKIYEILTQLDQCCSGAVSWKRRLLDNAPITF